MKEPEMDSQEHKVGPQEHKVGPQEHAVGPQEQRVDLSCARDAKIPGCYTPSFQEVYTKIHEAKTLPEVKAVLETMKEFESSVARRREEDAKQNKK